jgi:hypothetical protein
MILENRDYLGDFRNGSEGFIGDHCFSYSASRQKAVVPQPEFKAPSTSTLGHERYLADCWPRKNRLLILLNILRISFGFQNQIDSRDLRLIFKDRPKFHNRHRCITANLGGVI